MKLAATLAVPISILPLGVLEQTSRMLFNRLLKQHPGLFERLGEHRTKSFAFIPNELPIVFIVRPSDNSILTRRKGQISHPVDASVEGPLFMLLALLEGRSDADALFFSRDLNVTGDMEAVLAMRNALDDFAIDLPRDLAPLAGPFAPLFLRFGERFRRHALAKEGQEWN
ncbi:SCP2 sterol-binding domain-containing protein [Neorhizobium sp. T786]|uniref:ubiquinone anaerobic biosynthesis accessory factor UbiT n=1 Tax=Pseudorhizobium xiangyangii TaxID=2883104 RepID=UPI001CFFDC32|nr:SCP2 sterol-binding domain-containing protein [Neorhizobium xiangyangii]MCB5204693.1 SCP2 sterol-binding domain-containing protein [Neorhizobium xiangyangii]